MATRSTYRLDDEPRPGPLAQMAVSPFWPLLAMMLAGTWLGLPWFAFNSVAVGSPTRTRELLLVAVGFVGSLVLAMMLLHLWQGGYLASQASIQYALLVLLIWKLAIGYALFVQQSATIELYQYYGGVLSRYGIAVVAVASFIVQDRVVKIVPSLLWQLVMQ